MLLYKILRTVLGKSEKDTFYGFLVNLLGKKTRNESLYLLAFRHKSASLYEKGRKINNERLEYLGDAVLGAIVADILFKSFPNQKEGFLTKLRSKIVNRKQLNHLGSILGFEKHLFFNGTLADNTLGNCLEALIGAMYLDFGYNVTRQIVANRIIHKHIDFENLIQKEENFKSKLIEWAQHKKKSIVFSTDEQQKDAHPHFTSRVLINDELMGKGEGSSKKIAQQMAAGNALNKIYDD